MRYLLPVILLTTIILSSCAVSEDSMPGVYKPGRNSSSRLVLHPDKTFELSFLDPRQDSVLLPGVGKKNEYTRGAWQLQKRRLILQPASNRESFRPPSVNDSVAHFTNISSFNFWNRFGEPVPIRYILIPPSRPKPHYGNSLYFFSQDFKLSDTLKFFFEGFLPVSYPGTLSPSIGNNMHSVTLVESFNPSLFEELDMKVKKGKLIENGVVFLKKAN